jgi:hypothetical protein
MMLTRSGVEGGWSAATDAKVRAALVEDDEFDPRDLFDDCYWRFRHPDSTSSLAPDLPGWETAITLVLAEWQTCPEYAPRKKEAANEPQ